MPSTIVITRDNLDNDDNNSFTYNYPSGMPFDNHEVAVESVSIPYAWANISSVLGNNQFTYSWVVGSTETAYTVTVEDGLYELSDINARLQFEMITNGHYLQKDDDNIFYLEFVVNPNTYKFDLNTYVFPTSLPSGYTQPVADTEAGASAFPGFPTQTFRPRLQMVSGNNFHKLIGFAPDFDSGISTGATIHSTHSSITSPQIHPNHNVFIAINKIENVYASPSTIVHNLVPNVGFGQQIIDRPNQYAFVNIRKGNYNQINVQLLGADKTPLKNMLDSDVVIVLLIRRKKGN